MTSFNLEDNQLLFFLYKIPWKENKCWQIFKNYEKIVVLFLILITS